MSKKTLHHVGELYLITHLQKNFKYNLKSLIAGIGDDAAVIKCEEDYLLLTTDMMLEGVHFDLHYITPYQLGFKLISVNVSDIYAMGGTPQYALLNIALRKNSETSFFNMLFKGIKHALSYYKTVLIGGDISAVKKDISLAATVVGSTKKPILRSGAREGDKIYVTGYLGESACGLEILKKKGVCVKPSNNLLKRHLMPIVKNPDKIKEIATSMMDISDGLLIDLTRLCDESRVGAKIYEDKIPISLQMKRVALSLGLSPIELAMTGGEDYELLFTAPPDKKIQAIYIGDIVKTERVIINKQGTKKEIKPFGYQHF